MPGINLSDLKRYVITPTLDLLGIGGTAAVNLVTGTANVESRCCFLKQIGKGPALGLWQMEPTTERDIWANFLIYREDITRKMRNVLAPGETTPQLVWNLAYAAAMCRILYLRVPAALPAADDAGALSAYHKRFYNTALGAADAAANVPLFTAAIAA